jgi:hypothetical protein
LTLATTTVSKKVNPEWWAVVRFVDNSVVSYAERARDALAEARQALGCNDAEDVAASSVIAGCRVMKVKDARKGGTPI